MQTHFRLYKDAVGNYRWTLFAANNLKIADSGEGYVQKQDCLHGIALVRSTTSRGQFTFYSDLANQHRWRLTATNGRIIADSGQGYTNLHDCHRGADLVVSTGATTPIDDRTQAATILGRYA